MSGTARDTQLSRSYTGLCSDKLKLLTQSSEPVTTLNVTKTSKGKRQVQMTAKLSK